MAGHRETSSEEWTKSDALLARALELDDAAERLAFVREETRNDRRLGSAVESLLGYMEGADGLFEDFAGRVILPLAGDLFADDPVAASTDPVGSIVGRYRVLRVLARGGMGTVYLAERADAEYEQRVALKVLRRGLDTDDIVRRFRVERQILASLTHPNISRLLDGGSTDSGLPYLVMEFVEGEPLDEYCDRGGMSVEERLRLFGVVGRALQHAHNRLVVHRDLKPSNILVTPNGTVKLLDFGVAKLLDDEAYQGETARTRTGMQLLTPEYASPEQLVGDTVTTASDVYQLGLLLYDLLCGRAARDRARGGDTGSGATSGVWRRPSSVVAVPAAEPRATTVDRLRRRLRGDLDTIVLMALREDPDRRYPSAMQLVEDVERYLEGLPIMARPDSRSYRMGKFVRRHPAGVLASAALLIVLAGSAGTLAVQADRLADQRDRAVAEATRAEEATRFLLSVFEASDPDASADGIPSARDVLDAGAGRIERELASQPALRAELSGTIGQIYESLGMYDRAEPILAQAVALHEEIGEPTRAWARDLGRLAETRLTVAPESLLALRRRSVLIAETAGGPDDPLLADLLVSLALVKDKFSWNNPEHAALAADVVPDLDRAIAILRAHPGDVRRELAFALNTRAYKSTGEEKLALLREALGLRRAVLGPDHTVVAGNLNDLGLALQESDPAAADSLVRQAAETYDRVLGPEHPETLTIWNNFAGIQRDRGDLAGAAEIYERVLEIRSRRHPDIEDALGFTTYGLGVSLLGLGDHERAIAHLRATLHHLVGRPPLQQIARLPLARALAAVGRHGEAERELLIAWEWWRDAGDEASAAGARDQLIGLYTDWERPERARALRNGASPGMPGPPQ